MSAPGGTQWGNIIQGSKSTRQGRIGAYVWTTSTETQTTVNVQVWFWSMYSISDTNNNYYADWDRTYATSGGGAVGINTSVSTGGGWNTANQVLLGQYSRVHNRGASDGVAWFSARLRGIDNLGAGNEMTIAITYGIPALASYTVSYNANGGEDAPESQTKLYGHTLILSGDIPTRQGYNFVGWSTSPTETNVIYQPGGEYTDNASTVLYAIWQRITHTVTYDAGANGGTINGSTIVTQSVEWGNKLGVMPVPVRQNYKFIEWNTDKQGKGIKATSETVIYSNVTLYPIFELQANCYLKEEGLYEPSMLYLKNEGLYENGIVYVKEDGIYQPTNM